MAKSISDGSIYNYTSTGAVTNGELRIVNRMAGVCLNAATGSGVMVPVALDGVYNLSAVATGEKSAGSLVYCRTTGSQWKVTCVAAGATGATGATGSEKAFVVGTVFETATAAATTLNVRLIGAPMRKL